MDVVEALTAAEAAATLARVAAAAEAPMLLVEFVFVAG